ncbi:hypothetical protein BSK65_15075 [Paenibacillus odorifer]|uniref:Uncharacterized protein n=1 Tax=Paenibacillus odorifer TaxID=189426 RepID=A0A1R0ZFZ4_9BACL|nr:hypothetical protein [Paenibacillus odorifer]OMD55921.1 hypothetical protein BSK51_01880 [Paenibacillus odorifer]OME69326.1 hypothetical protein BSK65_15075 [Paenibacillus odorifer]
MKKGIFTGLLALLLITASMLSFNVVEAAGTVTKLPSPQWSQLNAVGALESIEGGPVELPSLNTVYLHTKEEHATQTKVWLVDTLKSYDTQTGKLKWSVNFADPGTAMFRESKDYLVAPDGTVYITFTDNLSPDATQIYAVGPDGKRKWKVNLSQTEGYLYRLDNGSLVFASQGNFDNNGNYTGSLTLINKSGTKVKNISYKGTVLAQGNRVLIQTNYGGGKGSRIQALDSSLNSVFTYQMPADSYTEVSYNHVLSDGTVLVRANIPKTGNRLFGFSSKGNLLWGRDIAGDAVVSSLGDVYGVYANGKLSLYNVKGLVKSVALKDVTEFFISLDRLQDGNIELGFPGSATYVLNPKTLAVDYTFKLKDDFNFNYVGNGVGYVMTDNGFSRIKF